MSICRSSTGSSAASTSPVIWLSGLRHGARTRPRTLAVAPDGRPLADQRRQTDLYLPPHIVSTTGVGERPADGPASLHIRVSRCAGVTRHPARRRTARKREITKTRKPETKCRRLPEPQHSLCMRFTVRFAEAWAIADRRRCPAPRPVQRHASPRSPGSFAKRASPAHRHLGYPGHPGRDGRARPRVGQARSPLAGRHRPRRDTDRVGCARGRSV
jgi:hypothetical protein